MKPVYLEFCGINSFSEPARIDFTKLLQGGVFGIFGDTGSGKSTVLDAIHFALYGEVDRVPKSFNDCINHRLDGASVTFDFELTVGGTRKTYRVKREKKRKNASGKAWLYEYTAEKTLFALSEGTRDVNAKVEEIIGLTFEDFKTCIALPQGDFATLVKATPAERVKLVARLFNLEKYGERLTASVNERCKRAEEEKNIVLAKIGETANCTKSALDELSQKIKEDKTALMEQSKSLSLADERLKKAENLQKEKQALDALIARLGSMQSRLPEMERTRTLLQHLPQAKSVIQQAQALEKLRLEKDALSRDLQESKKTHAHLLQQTESLKERLEKENYDERIVTVRLQLQRYEQLSADIVEAENAHRELEQCQAQYRALTKKCPAEDFDGKAKALEDQITALGNDENLLDYLMRAHKGVLLGETYAQIREDLRALQALHPEVQADVLPLIEKYTLTATASERLDIADANTRFKLNEQKKKALKAELDALETRRRAYRDNESEKALLEKQGKLIRQRYETANEKIAQLKDLQSEKQLKEVLEVLKNSQTQLKESVEKATQKASEVYARAERINGSLTAQEKTERESQTALDGALTQTGFACVKDAETLVASVGDESVATQKTTAFFQELTALVARRKEVDESAFVDYDENAFLKARAQKDEIQQSVDALNRRIGAEETQLKVLKEQYEKHRALQAELAEKQNRLEICEQLKSLVRGNRFLEFVASEYLQEISASASTTLSTLSGGRYFLKYEDKEFKVADNFDGGNRRAVKTLSGGETFLVSLSLALALSSAICMKSLRPIEFFFLDEGFGTLDEKLVDTVMNTLSKLGKSFSVGLISHVEELKRRIEQKILVTPATETHGSQIQVITY